MLTCKKCGFNVNGALKHSININQCPRCGNFLMSNEKLSAVNSIVTELNANGFNYTKSELKMLAIFFVNKLSNAEEKSIDHENGDILYNEEESKEDYESQEFHGQDYNSDEITDFSKIRDEISNEYDIINEEYDDKVTRLQRLAKDNKILNKRGVSVRRVSDD